MVTKNRLYDLVDTLPEDVWPEAERILLLLAIPEDDEELTPEALERIEASRAAGDRGETVSHAEAIQITSDLQWNTTSIDCVQR